MPVAPVRTLVQTACAKDTAISRIEIIKSVDFLPAPPGNDSIDFARDSEIYRQTQARRGANAGSKPLSSPTPDSIKMQEHGLKRPLA